MATTIEETLAKFDPTKGEKYDPGQLVILFDNRTMKTSDDKFSIFQSYWTEGLYRLGWPSLYKTDLDPGMLRIVFYTHAGNEGYRDYPLYRANAVKEMFDSLSEEGFRPMVLAWSAENPYPMIGGTEPPSKPKQPKVKVATSWSGTVSGHREGDNAGTPHDRVMAIINENERREAESRKGEVEKFGQDDKKDIVSPV